MINSAKVAEELKNEGGWVGSRNETTKTLFAFSLIYFYHAVFYFAPFNYLQAWNRLMAAVTLLNINL